MGAEMPCPRCDARLEARGDYMVCVNVTCGYYREIVKHIPSQAELLKENKELKEYIATLENLLRNHGIPF